jgi:hypothetical protein
LNETTQGFLRRLFHHSQPISWHLAHIGAIAFAVKA